MRSQPNSWMNTLTSLGFKRTKKKAKQTKRNATRSLRMESLEDRTVLSASALTVEPFVEPIGPTVVPQQLSPQEITNAREQEQSILLDSSIGVPKAFVTTTGSSANYITPSGTSLDGVVDIIVNFPSGSQARGTGSLLLGGEQVLTAAHIFFDSSGVFASGATVYIDTPSGTSNFTTFAPQINPAYTGSVTGAGDIALLKMNGTAPVGVNRFDIYRDTDEIGHQFELAGYGRSGTGTQGSVLASGVKRNGENRFDALGEDLNGAVYPLGTVSSGTHLVFDFDNGSAAQDASGVWLGANDLGVGTNEVSTAPGDSGGPALIDGKIAGVTSFGQGFNGATDTLAGTNSSFGELAVDTRVSAYASWIDSLIDIIGPQVLNVTMGAASPSNDEFSFDTVDGSGLQLRTVPLGLIDEVSIQFSEDVNVSQGDLRFSGLGKSTDPALDSTTPFSYNVATNTATWNFAAPLAADNYLITLDDAITDLFGHALDGEWVNPNDLTNGTGQGISEFPSGNGSAGGNFEFVMTVLPGDINGDNKVNIIDLGIFSPNYGGPGSYLQGDLNGDGFVNIVDLGILSVNYNAEMLEIFFAADFNGDNSVDIIDMGILGANFQTTYTDGLDHHADGDANGDGSVDIVDFGILGNQWGLHFDTI